MRDDQIGSTLARQMADVGLDVTAETPTDTATDLLTAALKSAQPVEGRPEEDRFRALLSIRDQLEEGTGTDLVPLPKDTLARLVDAALVRRPDSAEAHATSTIAERSSGLVDAWRVRYRNRHTVPSAALGAILTLAWTNQHRLIDAESLTDASTRWIGRVYLILMVALAAAWYWMWLREKAVESWLAKLVDERSIRFMIAEWLEGASPGDRLSDGELSEWLLEGAKPPDSAQPHQVNGAAELLEDAIASVAEKGEHAGWLRVERGPWGVSIVAPES